MYSRTKHFPVRLLVLSLLLIAVVKQGSSQNSPYTLKSREDIIIFGTGALAFGGAYFLFNNQASPNMREVAMANKGDIPWFDRSATENWNPGANKLSEAMAALAFAPLIPLAFNPYARKDVVTTTVMTAEMLIWAISLPQISKITFQRKRPYFYNEEVDMDEKLKSRAMESFFSRTSTVAFAAAVYSCTLFDAWYPSSPWSTTLWSAGLGMAATSAFMKYHSGQHFPSDIIAGAIAGSFIGWAIPYIHQQSNNEKMSLKFKAGLNYSAISLRLKY